MPLCDELVRKNSRLFKIEICARHTLLFWVSAVNHCTTSLQKQFEKNISDFRGSASKKIKVPHESISAFRTKIKALHKKAESSDALRVLVVHLCWQYCFSIMIYHA
jgi:hypothetical protein